MSRPPQSTNDHLLSLLAAYPGQAVLVYAEGHQYRAALVDKPARPSFESECRSWPDDAIDRLHEKAYEGGEARHQATGEFLSLLTKRRLEKRSSVGPSEGSDGT